jgi:hypothetical protein
MMMSKVKYYIAFVFIVVSLQLSAQTQDMGMHNLLQVPQSQYNNPANVPFCKFYIGFPALSSLYVGFSQNTLIAENIISKRPDDSLYLDVDNFIESLHKRNYLFAQVDEEILSFGFRLKEKHYISFNLTEHMYFRMGYPKDFMEFVAYGNGANFDNEMEVGGFSLNMAHYREMGFGYSYKYDDKWTFGARYKLLFGLSNLWTKETYLSLHTAEEDYFITASANLEAHAHLPEAAWLSMQGEEDEEVDIGEYMMNFGNMGMGIDLGATYKMDDKWTFGASVIDLGYIRFKGEENTRSFKSINPEGSFTFQGIDINDYLNKPDSVVEENMDNFLDSIVDIFDLDTLKSPYSYPLNTKIYLSAAYELTDKDRFSALAKFEFWNGKLHPSGMLSYNRKFGKILSLTANYSVSNYDYFNLGLGFNVNLGPFQMYLVTDNVIDPIIHTRYSWMEDGEREDITVPKRMKDINAHFGINFIFGYKEKVYAPIIN